MTASHPSLARLEGPALMERVAEMDPAAFALVYDRHVASAYGLAYRIVGGRQPADEVCQEAFLSVWRSAGTFDAELGNIRSWVLAVVRNRAIDHLRRTTRTRESEVQDEGFLERGLAPDDQWTESSALRNATAEETRRALAGLSADQRRVIELSFFSGFCHREIAELLHLPLGTVKTHMRRGLARMRADMAPAHAVPATAAGA